MSIRSGCHHGEGGCRDQHLTIRRTTPCRSATKWDHNFHFKQHQVPNLVENVYEHGRHAWNLPTSPPRGDVALRFNTLQRECDGETPVSPFERHITWTSMRRHNFQRANKRNTISTSPCLDEKRATLVKRSTENIGSSRN